MTSALILPVPEAEPLVAALRAEGDPSAARGVPAHVTLLHPFVPDPDAGVEAELGFFFAHVDGFDLTFSEVADFPEVVYLAPDQAKDCAGLTEALALRWPGFPPYGGAFDTVVPHLTVVDSPDPALRERARAHLRRGLPVRSVAREAQLWVQGADGHWSCRSAFPLAAHR